MLQVSVDQTLQDLNLKAHCVRINQYRHFIYYDLVLDSGGRINKIANSVQEIGLALKTKTVPILKVIPGGSILRLRASIADAECIDFAKLCQESPQPNGLVPCLLGETEDGQPLWMDAGMNPHLLIAGSTGAGKSALLHILIANALKLKNGELHLIDTKKVEFGAYNNKATSISKCYSSAIETLEYLCEIMELRFSSLEKTKLSSIEKYPQMFSKIVLIVDEVADLIMLDQSQQFQNNLIKLVSKSRAAGIYVILATQRPSVDVLTGTIKANFPARIALKVSSRVDSQIILDMPGAELLAGKGDGLFKSPVQELIRFQTAFINKVK